MAEVLAVMGIIANIVQIVDFGERVISRLNDFHRTVNNCPRAFRQTMTEVPLLVDTLKQTEKGIAAGTVQEDTARALFPVVEGCREQLETLDSLLKKALPKKGDSMGTRNLKALSSLIQEPKVEKLNRSIHRYIQTLTFYHAAAASTAYPSVGEKLAKLRRWLSAPDPSPTQYKLVNERLANTGLWFLKSQKYIRWKTDIMSFLWLYGIPGSGKSVLCSGIVEDVSRDCESDAGKAIAYYYFSFSSLDDQAPEQMIKSLISQFSEKCVRIPASLESVLSSDLTGQRQPPLHKLLDMLRAIMQEFPASYIVLDGLDECPDREGLLGVLTKIVRWELENLHMIVLSRDEPDIRRSLEDICNEKDTVCLRSGLVDEDIGRYVRHRLANDKKLRRWHKDHEIRQEIETKLIEKAQGMFRWAACQMDMLANSINRSLLRKYLRNLPPTLGETYERILCGIDDVYREYARNVLRWLAFSARPLYVEEVAEVVAISDDDCPHFDRDAVLEDPMDVLSICPSLITVVGIPIIGPAPKEFAEEGIPLEQKSFTLAHYSVKEYLLSDLIQKSSASAFWINETAAHSFIAKSCLAYISQFRDKDSVDTETGEQFKLAIYAAEFWPHHVRASGKDATSTYDLAMELLSLKNDNYVNWFRLFDMDHSRDMNLTLTSEDIPAPLYAVSSAGLTEIARLLITEHQLDVNRQCGRLGTALQAASFRGQETTVELLLGFGADPNIEMGDRGSALLLAASRGHFAIVQRLLAAGADVNWPTSHGTALHKALDVAVAKLLIDAGANINAIGGEYGTALQEASYLGRDEVVDLLLKMGAHVNIVSGLNGTALQAALVRKHDSIVDRLLKAGSNLNLQGGRYGTALQAACATGQESRVRDLIAGGADVNLHGGRYGTALHAAVINRHDNIVEILLASGVDIEAHCGQLGTALHAASANGYEEIVKRLLAAGADVNSQGECGTPLQAAIGGGHHKIAVQLLEAGADFSFGGDPYDNPLQAPPYTGANDLINGILNDNATVKKDGGKHGTSL
ncbi:hypothetical protein VTN96DRAFT_7546 [Rasamsonia emersonii]